jgi:hypothetical protein
MKLIFSALSDITDDIIQTKINGIKGEFTEDRTNLSVDSLGGGAASDVIKQLIDALIAVIKEQRLLRMDIIDNLSSACESAETAYNVHEDSGSFKAELGKSLTPPTRPSRPGAVTARDESSTSQGVAEAPGSSRSVPSGSASSSFSTSFNNLASRFMGTSGEAGNISSMGSSSCGDAKVMCDENGIIQVQINLQDLLSNCFSSNGETGGDGGSIISRGNGNRGNRDNGESDHPEELESAITKPVNTKPVNTALPTITGGAVVGSTLNVSNGGWDGSSISYTYQWYRDGNQIPGATTNVYTTVDDDIRKKITCKVTASNSDNDGITVSSDAITVTKAGDSNPPSRDNTEDTPTIDSVRAAYTKYYGLYGKVAAGGGGGEEYGGGGGYDIIQEGGTSLTNSIFQGKTAYYTKMNDRIFNFNGQQITTKMMNQENLTRLKEVVDKMTTDGKDVDNRDPADSGEMFKGSNEISGWNVNRPGLKTVIFSTNKIAGSGKNIAEYLLKGNTKLQELRLESCDLTEADITAIMNVFLETPSIALESLKIGGNPGLTVQVLLSMLDMFANTQFSKNLNILNIIVAGSAGSGTRVSSNTIGARDAENDVDAILQASYPSSEKGSAIKTFGDSFQACLPGNTTNNSNAIRDAKQKLNSSAKLKPEVTGGNYLQELKQAKDAYDASVTSAMPIATHIKIMEDVVAKFAPIPPTPETEPAADATVPKAQAQEFAYKAASTYLSELTSTQQSTTAVTLNADALTGATQTFNSTLDVIDGKHEASKSSQQNPVLETEPDLGAKKDAIIREYNKILDYISNVITNQEPCKTITSGNLQTYIQSFNASIDDALISTGESTTTVEFRANVHSIVKKFIENIKANDSGNKFADIALFCKILNQQVVLYRTLTQQFDTEPPEKSRKQKYIEIVNGGIDKFMKTILSVNVKLNGTDPKNYAFTIQKPVVSSKGGSNSSRKHNSRRKGHRKSSSKARKSRRNTRSSSTSKNHKKVRFVKTS